MIGTTRVSAVLVFLACVSLAACGDSGSSMPSAAASSSSGQTTASTSSSTSSGTSASDGFTISGTVSGITGVAVGLTGAVAGAVTTDGSGNFSFATLGAGNYTIVPSKPGYVFSPVSLAVSLSSGSVTALSFAASATTAATYSISGTVAGSAAAGVTVTLNGSNIGSTVTDQSGNYTFTGLLSGTYTVTAAREGYSFTTPLIVSLSTVDSVADDFASALSATSGGLAFSAISALPQATVGSPYSAKVVDSITGGKAPYHYATGTLATGAPPLGMILNPSGNLTGTPTVPGKYDFGVCATDASGEAPDCQPTSITVATAQSSGPPAPTVTLAASPGTVTAGDDSALSWSSTNATACEASGGWTGAQSVSGSFTVEPTSSTTYVLTCTGPGGSAQASTLLTVTTSSPKAPSVAMSASPATIPPGSSTTLQWSSQRASTCVGSDGWSGSKATNGTHTVAPANTTTYTLACTNSAGTAQTSTKITVKSSSPPPAPTVTLNASSTTITSGGSSTLSWSTTNASSCAASGGWSGSEATSGTQSVSPTSTTTYTLNCTGQGGSAQASVTVSIGSGPSGTSWVYFNGTFDWPGDYSYDATPDYNDSNGGPMSGSHDIKITITSSWGGWLPYAQNWNFNSKGYTKLVFSLKPTVANQSWEVFFVKVGDVPVGIYLNPANYGPAPVVGQWGSYSIPLSDLGVLGTSIYKFAIADQTGRSNNVWYVDNVGFAP